MEFKKYKFKDICLEKGFVRGPFGSALKKSLFVPKGEDTYKVYEQCVPLEQNKNSGHYYITGEYFRKALSRFEVKHNDFLVSCSGVNYGAIYLLQEPFEKGVINQALLIIRIDDTIVDYNYFKYLFRIVLSRAITTGTGDSTIPNFPAMDVIKNIDVQLPSLDVQKRIGKILNDIDIKIATNNRVNDNLSKMAYDIYMHNFLSQKPNGRIKDILLEADKSPIQVGTAKTSNGKYPFFTSGATILKWDKPFVNGRNCYLNTGGNADVKFYVGEADYSTDTWCISAKSKMSDYLYLMLLSLKPELDQKFFQGTGLKHLQKPLLKDRPIYIPEKSELEVFNGNVRPMFDSISENIRENQQLISLSDWLLPMLMNGQATISD